MLARSPQKAEAGLKFPPGVNVVLKFCPYRHPQTAVHERDLVLGEDAVNVVGFIVGNEIDRGKSLDDLAWTPARAQPPNDVLMGKVGEVVNQVDIEGISDFCQLGAATVGPVEIRLHLKIGAIF